MGNYVGTTFLDSESYKKVTGILNAYFARCKTRTLRIFC